MLSAAKKIEPREGQENTPIDFAWVTYIGMNKLGFTEKEIDRMYFGKWVDTFEAYKNLYNFELQRKLYGPPPEEKKALLSEL